MRPWKALTELFGGWWEALVGWDRGRLWPIFAAVLPPCIPIARSLEENSPPSQKGITVAVLLFSIAFLQIYGQARNKRERKAAEDRFNDQSIAINAIADAANRVENGFNDQSIAINAIADAASRVENRFNEQSAAINAIATAINAIATETIKQAQRGNRPGTIRSVGDLLNDD